MFQNHKQQGFTVIELTLAMAFLAFIMIFTTTVTVQMMRTYNKGLTIKQINQAGRTITEDLSRSLSAGVPTSINSDYIPQGRLCIGNFVYAWTPTYNSATHDYTAVTYTNVNGKPAGLVRVPLTPNSCSATVGLSYDSSADMSVVPLLSTQARVLDVKVEKYGVGDRLVELSFIIGTYEANEASALATLNTATPQYKDIYITPYYDAEDKMTCRPNDDGNFCSFATFKTTVYVGNR